MLPVVAMLQVPYHMALLYIGKGSQQVAPAVIPQPLCDSAM